MIFSLIQQHHQRMRVLDAPIQVVHLAQVLPEDSECQAHKWITKGVYFIIAFQQKADSLGPQTQATFQIANTFLLMVFGNLINRTGARWLHKCTKSLRPQNTPLSLQEAARLPQSLQSPVRKKRSTNIPSINDKLSSHRFAWLDARKIRWQHWQQELALP